MEDECIEIYFYSKLAFGLSFIEDEINDLLEDKGEVSGGGSGVNGSNIDIDIYEGVAVNNTQR